ncbi:unnamed protein product, partial [Closterium sp. NIES-54]
MVCLQRTTHDALARLAVRSHLPPAERAHFGQYKTAKSLYDAVAVLLTATVAPLSLRGVPLSPFSPLLLLLLLSTLLALRRSGLRLLPVGGAAKARARGARVVEGMAGAAAEAVEEAEGVAVEVGVVPGVGALVVAVEVVEAAVEVVEAVAAVAEVVVVVVVQPRSVEALVVAIASSSRVPVRPRRPSSFVSGTLGVG